jgi:hypothetical protein
MRAVFAHLDPRRRKTVRLGDERATLRRLLLTALAGSLGGQPPGGSCV